MRHRYNYTCTRPKRTTSDLKEQQFNLWPCVLKIFRDRLLFMSNQLLSFLIYQTKISNDVNRTFLSLQTAWPTVGKYTYMCTFSNSLEGHLPFCLSPLFLHVHFCSVPIKMTMLKFSQFWIIALSTSPMCGSVLGPHFFLICTLFCKINTLFCKF